MRATPLSRPRRGSALFLVMVFTFAVGTLAASAFVLTSSAGLMTRHYDRERELRYAAEATLAIGKSRLRSDPYAMPDSGYATLLANGAVLDADGQPLRRVTASLYAGRTGNNTGQFGRFASLVADVRDSAGSHFVRRLELAEENFARFAYWTDRESNNGSVIYFGGGDVLYGPVWSNDDLHIYSTGASFYDAVGTAGVVQGKSYGTFKQGVAEHQPRIELPTTVQLANLQGYAAAGNFSFAAPNRLGASGVLARLEFVAIDLDASGDSTGDGEGFFRVYVGKATKEHWVRGDYGADNCGDWHRVAAGGPLKFFPARVHNAANAWLKTQLVAGGMTSTAAGNELAKSFTQVMTAANARCFPGGDPHLVAVERNGAAGYVAADWQKGGEDTTFTPSGVNGAWTRWPGTPVARLVARRGATEAQYMFPLYRGDNPATKGVIYVDGTIAVSGVVRGQVTLFANGTVVFVDDLRYATDPGSGRCADILGIIAANDAVVADNGVASPQDDGTAVRSMDDTPDMNIHAVIMALNQSFMVENYAAGPTNATPCGATPWGRGCLYLVGGLIQQARGPVGTTAGTGYLKRYSYDRCTLRNPPPYFPTTGRLLENRYSELDPVRFDAATLFRRLTPGT